MARPARTVALAVVALFAALSVLPGTSLAYAQQEAPQSTELADLEKGKLEEEVRQLRIENDRSASWLGIPILLAPAISAVVAVGGLAWAIWRQSKELGAAREAAGEEAVQWRRELKAQQEEAAKQNEHWEKEFDRQQALDREERLRDRRARFEARIADVMTNMGSDQLGVRVNAVSALGLFARDDYPELHADLLSTVIANLKLDPQPTVADILRAHLARLLRLVAEREDAAGLLGERLDLTRMNLYRLDASGIAFPDSVQVDLYRSDLRHANLSDARLFRALGGNTTLDAARFSRAMLKEARFDGCHATADPVQFHGTILHSATFKGAVMRGAEFQQAELQGAHFTGADLRGARFEGAQLAEVRFVDARLDSRSIQSIARGAHRWRDAHFDPLVRAALEAVSDGAPRGS